MQDLNSLKVFHDVVKAGGFSAAHRETGQSRATLSRHVNALEEELGTRLIERTTRSFRLTEPGELLYARSVEILEQMEAVVAQVENRQREARGLVRIAVPPSLLRLDLGQQILGYLQANPKVQAHVEVSNREVDLRHEAFDFVVRARASLDYPLDFVPVRLAEVPRVIVAHPRWASSLKSTLVETLEEVPVVAWNGVSGRSRWELVNGEGEAVTVPLQPRLMVNDVQLLREAVMEGLGAAVIPHNHVAEDLALNRLIRIDLDLSPRSSTVHAVHLGRAGMRPAVRQLLDWLKEATANLR